MVLQPTGRWSSDEDGGVEEDGRRRLDAEEDGGGAWTRKRSGGASLFSGARDATRESAARTLEVGSAHPREIARTGSDTPMLWTSKQ